MGKVYAPPRAAATRNGRDADTVRPIVGRTPRDTAIGMLTAGLWPVPLYPLGAKIPGRDKPSEGKEPIGKGWGLTRNTPDTIHRRFKELPKAGIGVALGPGRGPAGGWLIDVEGDGPEAEESRSRLYGGEDVETLGWGSARGRHQLLTADPDRLAELLRPLKGLEGKGLKSGVYHLPEFPGLEIRLGGIKPDGAVKQVQSAFPPTRGTDGQAREWNGVAAIAPAPESLYQALGRAAAADRPKAPATAAPPAKRDRNGSRPGVETRAVLYLNECQPAVSGEKGHNQAFKVACKVGPGFDLPPDVALRLIRERYNPRCVPPWSEQEMRHKVDEAYAKEERRGWLRDAPPNGRHKTGSNGPANGHADGNGRINGASVPPPSGPPRSGAEGKEPPKPEIIISHKLHEVVAEAVAALARDPHVYQRGAALVTMVRNVKPPRGMKKTEGTPQINTLTPHRILELMSGSAEWKRTGKDRNGEVVCEPAAPPEKFARMVAERCDWPGIRPLEGIIEAPTLRPDGTVLQDPGYDEDTGLFFLPNEKFNRVKDRPTLADAKAAAARLLRPVADFPFEDDSHRHAWLASCLTDVARFGIEGPCPMFLFDSNVSGAGKTKLCDIIAVIATGRLMPRSSYSDNDAEMSKQILSIALGGFRLVLFDNLRTGDRLGGPALDRALTATAINERLLGSSKMSGEIPLYTVFHATGNNLGLKGDALRRIVPVRLESAMERPEERREFSIPGDLLEHVRENRAALVADALTIVRAYVVAGRPTFDLTPMDYGEWCGLIRNAVRWACGVDPCATRLARIAEDDAAAELAGLIEGWDALCHFKGVKALTAAEAVQALEGANPADHKGLPSLLADWSKDGKLPSARTVGNKLARFKGRPSGGKAFAFEPGHAGHRAWYVKSVQARRGDSGDSGDSDPKPTGKMCADSCQRPFSGPDENRSHQSHQSHQGPPATWTAPGHEGLF